MENRKIDSKEKDIIHPLNKESKSKFGKYTKLVSVIMILLLGAGSGFLIAQLTIVAGVVDKKVEVVELQDGDAIVKGLVVGVDDKDQYPGIAEGKLVEGGIDGEGSHHLERPGGESQNVYLTSSNVDLDKFTGSMIKVNGKTYDAEKAGWFMDVGQLEVLE